MGGGILNAEKTKLRWRLSPVNVNTHITSVVFDSVHVALVYIGGWLKLWVKTEVRMEDLSFRMQQVSSRNIQKPESIRRKFRQPQKNHKRFRKL